MPKEQRFTASFAGTILSYNDSVTGRNIHLDTAKITSQVIRDEAEKQRGYQWLVETGTSQVKADDKLDARLAVWARFEKGVRKAPRTYTPPETPVEVDALALVKKCSVGEAQAAWRSYDAAQQKRLVKLLPGFEKAIERLTKQKTARLADKKPDPLGLDALLEGNEG